MLLYRVVYFCYLEAIQTTIKAMFLAFDEQLQPDFIHVDLPRSKSESNRALLLSALSENRIQVEHWADCDDTQALQRCLRERAEGATTLDVGAAGTTMRFLTAFLAHSGAHQPQNSTVVLCGSARMHQRPIAPLVDALRALGANIEYMGTEGCPPLRIAPRPLHGGIVALDAQQSSQYLSALMMLAPTLPKGLEIQLTSSLASAGYAAMTADMLQKLGARVDFSPPLIKIAPTGYSRAAVWQVEADYSAASYWFAAAALAPKPVQIQLQGLKPQSLQPDAAVVDIFADFGISSEFNSEGLRITRRSAQPIAPEVWSYDFAACPDIAQTLAVACAALGTQAHLTGLQTLRIKETDRIGALQTELSRFDTQTEAGSDWLRIAAHKGALQPPSSAVQTYEDHRMAMAFAPLVLRCKSMEIAHSEVVAKSYPTFWADWQRWQR